MKTSYGLKTSKKLVSLEKSMMKVSKSHGDVGLVVMRPHEAVGWSVCHDREPCKTAEPIEMPFAVWTRVGPRKHMLDGLG